MSDDDKPFIQVKNEAMRKVVCIGEARVERVLAKNKKHCRCFSMTYDQDTEQVWCADCHVEITAYKAFEKLVKQYEAQAELTKRAREKLEQDRQSTLHFTVAKELEKQWRSHKTVPCCPRCNEGLLADDFRGRINTASKELVRQKRKNDNE